MLATRIKNWVLYRKNQIKIASVRLHLKTTDLTIISQNCIGGVFYHDMKLPFQSPTVNAFIPQPDFIRFTNNLDHYLQVPLDLSWDAEYPIGRLGDVSVHFVHYETCRDAADAWARRKTRIRFDKILVLCTDRDGFTDEVFDQWREIQYPKLLFTANPKYAQDKDSVYFPEYKKDGCIPDIIPDRKFYKDGILLQRVNSIEETQA